MFAAPHKQWLPNGVGDNEKADRSNLCTLEKRGVDAGHNPVQTHTIALVCARPGGRANISSAQDEYSVVRNA